MGIFNVTFPRDEFAEISSYERIINRILKLDIPFSILKFNLTENGIDLKLDVPNEKFELVREEFKKESVKIKNETIEIDESLCIDCGQCIALCNTNALYFDKDFKRQFNENNCVGFKLCIDACPRGAIIFK